MLSHIVKLLKDLGMHYLWFDARESALSFYNRLGFTVTGKRFYKNDIAYYKMNTNLQIKKKQTLYKSTT